MWLISLSPLKKESMSKDSFMSHLVILLDKNHLKSVTTKAIWELCQIFPLPPQHVVEEVYALGMHGAVVEHLVLGPSLHLPSLTGGPESPQAERRIGTHFQQVGRRRTGEMTGGWKCGELRNITKNERDSSKEVKWRGWLGTSFYSLTLSWPSKTR